MTIGEAMEFREMCLRAALAVDTLMSRAMLRALGVPMPEPRPARTTIVPVDMRFADMGECFANASSPMDMLR